MKGLRLLRRKDIVIRPMSPDDMEDIRFVGQEAWSDLASHDIGRKVKYPIRSRQIIEGYMSTEPKGCLVAERKGEIIGAAYSHVWGSVGWLGPFEVLPEHQNTGVGSALLEEAEHFLRDRGVRVLGLETMSHIPKNLHFYLSHGYHPTSVTLITDKILDSSASRTRSEMPEEGEIKEAGVIDHNRISQAMKRIGNSIYPGLDPSCEFEILLGKELGVTFFLEKKGEIFGVVLLHTYQRPDDDDYSSIKLLLVDPLMDRVDLGFVTLLRSCEDRSFSLGRTRIYARFPIKEDDTYRTMVHMSYRIKGANIRFVKGAQYSEKGVYNLSSWAG